MKNGKERRRLGAGSFLFFCLAILLIPQSTHAITLVQVAELFNIFVGIMLTASLLLFFGGLGVYFARLGTWPSNRDEAIKTMEWGVAVLFMLIIILVIVQFFQKYPGIMAVIIGLLAILLILGLILYVAAHSREEKKTEG